MNRLKSLLLTLAMLLCTISASAHDFEVDGIYYNITDSEKLTVKVTYRGRTDSDNSNEYTGNVVIPETVTYDSNTYSVTSIGSETFYNCSSLTSVTIPNSVTSIGWSAFRNCSSLTSVTIPDGVTSIGRLTFSGCHNLTSVTIPNSVTSIDDLAFSNCSSLTSVTIPDGVTSIGERAFYDCSSLTSVTIGNSVTSIGEVAFYNCSSLTSVTIPDGVTSIGDEVFWRCSSLTAVTIGKGVTSIGSETFYDCSSLTSVTIPNSVTSIGSGTFYGCSSLTSVTIGKGVTSIGSNTFSSCDSLSSVHVSDIAAWCNIKFSSSSSNPLYYAKHLYINGKEITKLTIPDGVTSIGNYTFSECTSLTSVTIPNSVTSIGYSAFSGCTNLNEITCKAETPPTTGTFVFDGIDKTIPLYVPKGSVLKYKAAANWKDFVIIREIAESETDVYLTITDCANGNVKLKVDEVKPYFTLKIEAETGWHVHSVTFNDGDVTAELSADGEYTTPAIGTDSRLNIVYAQGSSSINSVSDSKIKVWASGNNIIVDNAILNETINVYTLDGMKITSVNANSNRVEIPLTTGVVYIVKVADKVLKVAL